MIKVALITSWPPELCGIASNSVNVVNHKAADIEYKIIEGCAWARPFTHEQVVRESQDADIVHLSYERNLHAGLGPGTFELLKSQGKKLVITYHNVWPGDHQDDHMLAPFDVVVSQDPASPAERGFEYIAQGIMEVPWSTNVDMKLGQAGFPTQFKNGHLLALIARELGLGLLMFAPTSIHADANWMEHAVRLQVPDAEIIRTFEPQQYVASRLSECLVVGALYAAHSGQSGISGSCRLQLASGRPTVISRCGMYRDLFSYEDELYFLGSDTPSMENALPVFAQAVEDAKAGRAKMPRRVIKDMAWTKAGEKYAEIYRRLMA